MGEGQTQTQNSTQVSTKDPWAPAIPGLQTALNDAQTIRERFEKQLGAVIDAGACPSEPTTVVDLTPMGAGDDPVVIRLGRGSLALLGL